MWRNICANSMMKTLRFILIPALPLSQVHFSTKKYSSTLSWLRRSPSRQCRAFSRKTKLAEQDRRAVRMRWYSINLNVQMNTILDLSLLLLVFRAPQYMNVIRRVLTLRLPVPLGIYYSSALVHHSQLVSSFAHFSEAF